MGEYQIGKDLSRLELRMDSLEKKVELMGAQTKAALEDLDGALQEVAGELEDLASQVESSDSSAASDIRDRAQRLRDLRPDQNVPTDTTPAEPPPDSGVVTDDQGNPPV